MNCSRDRDESSLSLKEAEQLVLSQVLEDNLEGKTLYELPDKVIAGSVIKNGYGSGCNEYVVEDDSWFFFIDDMPGWRYAHPCRYVFVTSAGGAIRVIDEQFPPTIINDLIEVEA